MRAKSSPQGDFLVNKFVGAGVVFVSKFAQANFQHRVGAITSQKTAAVGLVSKI